MADVQSGLYIPTEELEDASTRIERHNHYAHAQEKFVKNVILYIDDNAVLYYDKTFHKPVSKDELRDLYLDGVIVEVVSAGFMCTPKGYDPLGYLVCDIGSVNELRTIDSPTEQ